MPAMAILPSPRARRARLRLACAGAVLGLLGAGIAAEAWVRLTQPYATPATERQRSWRYQAALLARSVLPQMEQARREPAQRINARGYRGPPFAVPKPSGKLPRNCRNSPMLRPASSWICFSPIAGSKPTTRW